MARTLAFSTPLRFMRVFMESEPMPSARSCTRTRAGVDDVIPRIGCPSTRYWLVVVFSKNRAMALASGVTVTWRSIR